MVLSGAGPVNPTYSNIEMLAKDCRRVILKMTNQAGASHVASALSVIDILATVYSGALNIRSENKAQPDRDVVILS